MHPRRPGIILSALLFSFSLFFSVSSIYAVDTTGDNTGEDTTETLKELDDLYTQDGSLDKDLQEFCEKRKGNQMNLETWYSGKCTDDTFSGEGVGFSDIVILDLAEKLSGKKDPDKTFSQTLKSVFDALKSQDQSLNTEEEKAAALASARQKIFSSQDTGLIGESNKVIGLLYKNQPASTQSYVAYVADNLQRHKIIDSALAADTTSGVGFSTFSPFLTIWTAFRNLAYLFLVVFFVVYGFMMMFRVNLGQKTAITVQLALPKLIVTLLIITFSYAIVGLLYDLMWVLLYFIFGYFKTQNIIVEDAWKPATTASGMGFLGMTGSMLINTVASIPASFLGITNILFGKIGTIIAGANIAIISFATSGFFNVIIMLILLVAIIISYGKLIFKLITSFVTIIVSLVTAPIVLLGNAFPGSNAISTWFMRVFANLVVFPITALLLFFSYLLMIQPLVGTCQDIADFINFFNLGNVCTGIFGVADLVPGGGTVLGIPLIAPLGGYDARSILALLGVGLLLMAAKYVDIVTDALKVPPFKYGTSIGEALKSGISWAPAVGGDRVADSSFYQKVSGISGAKPNSERFFPPKQPKENEIPTTNEGESVEQEK